MNYRVAILLLASLVQSFGASWYIDNAATGSNNGTSWANAWTNPTNVIWASVNPGDTVFVSGGSTSKTYTDDLVIGKDGTSGNPITVKIGQDAGHNGVAIFSNSKIHPNGSRPKFNIIDGGRDPSFVAPTNHQQVVSGPTCITNNIGFWVKDMVGTSSVNRTTSPNVWYLRGPDDLTIRWVQVSGMTNAGTHQYHEGDGTMMYMDRGDEGTDPQERVVFEYIWSHHNEGQQFLITSGASTNFGDIDIRFNWNHNAGEDIFEVSSGVTIRDSVIGPSQPHGYYVDVFQLQGDFIKIYNNDVKAPGHAYLRYQTDPSTEPTIQHSFWFYNNIITETPGTNGVWNEPFAWVHMQPDRPSSVNTISNLLFANNLIFNSEYNYFQDVMVQNPWIYWDKGAVTNCYLKDIKFVNNLIVMKHKGTALPSSTNLLGTGVDGGYEPFTTNDFLFDYNLVAGTNRYTGTASNILDTTLVTYMDVTTNLEVHPFKFSNQTNWPVWATGFELAAGDTAAKDTALDLSAYFTTDALNRSRNVGGAWDRGPLEYQETNLVLYLSFDSDTGTNAIDSAGNGYTGQRFVLTGAYPTNGPVASIGGLAYRPNATGNAYDFLWHTNNSYGLYNRDGGYFSVTNAFNALSNMSQFTLMCWARYNSASRSDKIGADFSTEANANLVSGGSDGQGTVGSWFLGRYNNLINQNETRFIVRTNGAFTGSWGSYGDPSFGYSGDVVINFPERGFDNGGDTTNWHHYAVTFSNGIVKAYLNGVACATNDMSANVTTLRLGGGAARPYDWVGIGVSPHVGTPEFEDEVGNDYPNNGFMNGGIDQVRIYNRTLGYQEIIDVANSEGAEFADAPTGGGGGRGISNAPRLSPKFRNFRAFRP